METSSAILMTNWINFQRVRFILKLSSIERDRSAANRGSPKVLSPLMNESPVSNVNGSTCEHHIIIDPEQVRPYHKADPRKPYSKKRNVGKSRIYTNSSEKKKDWRSRKSTEY